MRKRGESVLTLGCPRVGLEVVVGARGRACRLQGASAEAQLLLLPYNDVRVDKLLSALTTARKSPLPVRRPHTNAKAESSF